MTAPRNPVVRLNDIVQAAAKLAIVVGRGRASFDEDWMTYDLVVHELEIIGEAVVALPLEFRESHAQVAWQQAIWMRNQLIHGYAEIDYSIVLDTAVLDIPVLLTQVTAILTDMEGSPR